MFLSNGAPVKVPVGTLADTTPIFADANYYSRSSLELTGTWAAYGAIYKSQNWVATVIDKLAGATARLSLDLWESSDPQAGLDTSSALYWLLQRPNDRMDPYQLKRWVSAVRDIYGEAYVLKLRDLDGVVRELHPMHPANTIVHRRPDDGSIWYIYSSGVRNVSMLPPIPAADVIPFLNFNPDNTERGLSKMEALRQSLVEEDATRRGQASFWRKGARPGMVLSSQKPLSKPAAERLRASVTASHGGVDNTGGTLVLEDGITAIPMQLNSQEMQYVDSRKLTREEVCARYDVPPPVVHILDKATFSNITEQMRSMYRDTMAPRLGEFESTLAHHLVPDFGGRQVPRFNLDEVLRGDFEARAEAAVKLVTGAVMKPAEARPMFNLPPAGPEADKLYANQATQPLGTPVAGSLPRPGEPGALPPAKVPLAIEGPRPDAVKAERSMMGRLGGTKAATADRAPLIDEHARQLKTLFAAQRDDVLARHARKDSAPFNAQSWDQALADLLAGLATATAKVLGAQTAKSLGGSFDLSAMAEWIHDNAMTSAQRINTTTLDQLAAALEDAEDPAEAIGHVYDVLTGSRADQIASTRVSTVGGLAERTAAGQSGATHKTWVTGSDPRPDHAGMSGQTVRLGQPFSNGMDGPGDPSGGADEVAGCNCGLTFTRGAR